jgi:hypothetical protein
MLDVLHALEATRIGLLVRESLYGFPILVGIHIMSLVLSVGILVWFDLRLLGVALQRAAVSRVYRRLIPWASAGFLVMFTSGALLFTGYASAAYENPFFRVKMMALVLAAANALFYHRITERGRLHWDGAERPPGRARAAGVISIVLWGVVIFCGRMMAYTMY